MKHPTVKPALALKKGEERVLSGTALAEMLREVLAKGVPFRFKARGFSMSPFIKDGDVLTVSPLTKTPPALGSVVAYLDPHARQLVVHRIIGKKGGCYRIQGDTALIADRPVPQANILGTVQRVERKGKMRRFGIGPERIIIGLFLRLNCLHRFVVALRNRIRPLKRKSAA